MKRATMFGLLTLYGAGSAGAIHSGVKRGLRSLAGLQSGKFSRSGNFLPRTLEYVTPSVEIMSVPPRENSVVGSPRLHSPRLWEALGCRKLFHCTPSVALSSVEEEAPPKQPLALKPEPRGSLAELARGYAQRRAGAMQRAKAYDERDNLASDDPNSHVARCERYYAENFFRDAEWKDALSWPNDGK